MAPDLPQASVHFDGANHIISSPAQLQGTLLRGRQSRQGLEWVVIQYREGTTHPTPTHQLVSPSTHYLLPTTNYQLHSSFKRPITPVLFSFSREILRSSCRTSAVASIVPLLIATAFDHFLAARAVIYHCNRIRAEHPLRLTPSLQRLVAPYLRRRLAQTSVVSALFTSCK